MTLFNKSWAVVPTDFEAGEIAIGFTWAWVGPRDFGLAAMGLDRGGGRGPDSIAIWVGDTGTLSSKALWDCLERRDCIYLGSQTISST